MRLVIDFGEVLPIQMGVDLRRADAGVAEHFLHRAQVAGRLQDVGGKRVTQQVRMHVLAQAGLHGPALEAQLDAARRQAGAALAEEQSGRTVARQPLLQPGGQRGQGLLSNWHDAGFTSFAGDLRFT